MVGTNVADLQDLLKFVKQMFEETVAETVDELMNEMKFYSDRLLDMSHMTRDFILRGGKRVRPLLVLIGFWSRTWGLVNDNLRYLVSSIEFLHNYLLIHDDIMDRDIIRRGGPTAHVWYRDRCLEREMVECDHYGLSQAITSGDYLEALAIGMFGKLNLPSDSTKKLVQTYSRGLRLVAYGQYLDVLASHLPLRSVSERDILIIHTLKTASYTVELPLHLGAIAAGGEESLLNDLSGYALPAGLAFQLRDDILGLFGDERVTGKPVGSDVKGRKKTLLIIKAYEYASPSEKAFLEEIYDRKTSSEITRSDIDRVRRIVVETGSLDYVNRRVAEETVKARESVESSRLINNNAKNVLIQLLDLLVKREK